MGLINRTAFAIKGFNRAYRQGNCYGRSRGLVWMMPQSLAAFFLSGFEVRGYLSKTSHV
jgi:hypothetical protein